MDIILNPKDSILARESLGVSQAAVSRDTGINRVYISQFESGKRILEDTDQCALRDHYQDLGWDPTKSEKEKNKTGNSDSLPIRIRDGVVVLNDLTDDYIEETLAEIYSTKAIVQNAEKEEVPRGFFNGIDQEKAVRKAIWILLHYMKIHQLQSSLQGRKPQKTDEITAEKVETTSDYIHLFMKNYGII